jgi:D-alanine-D-alanine ligase
VCEEFVPGRDVYVGLLGNEPRVLPPVELVVRSSHPWAPRLATYRLKNDPRYRRKWGVHYRRARLDSRAMRTLVTASRRIFHALKLRDYARLDFRLTDDGRLYFIEANPNPDLDPHALNRSGCFAGVPYERLLRTIVESARRRGKS